MILSKKKQEEIERLKWFTGITDFTDEEIQEYFDWSEKGIGNGGRLAVCKQRQGILMGEYEKGLLEGIFCGYYTILGFYDGKLMPRCAVDFIKREMFKGIDAEVIENTYQKLIKQE